MEKLYVLAPLLWLCWMSSFPVMANPLIHSKQPGIHTIKSKGINHDSQYTWDIESPYVIHLTDQQKQHVVNGWIDAKVKEIISEFKDELKKYDCLSCPPEIRNKNGALIVRYEKIFLSSEYMSLRIDAMKSHRVEAHPANVLITLNYDLKEQKPIALRDLFLTADYLNQLSSIAYNHLVNRIPSLYGFSPKAPPKYLDLESVKKWIREGTAPKPENYQYFGLTDKALVIFFDQYQVAPRPAGIIKVEIPYNQLKNLKPLRFSSKP